MPQTTPWYHRPMRIAALQCNFENGKTLEVIDKWADMGFNTEQLFHPMADLYSALFDPAKHAGILREYIARAHERGIRIIVYANCHILGPSLEAHVSDWALHDKDGKAIRLYDNLFPSCCVNSPFRDYFFGSIDALGDTGLDGVFLDGPVIVPQGCWCRHCLDRYRRLRGGDLATAAAGERWSFFHDSLQDFLLESNRRLKARRPDALHYINFPLMHPTASFQSLGPALAYNDLLGTEGGFMFYGPPKEAYLYRPGVTARVLEAAAPDRPRVIFMSADQKPWSWYMQSPVETALCIATSVANAAGVWYGLSGSTALLETPGAKRARELFRFMAAHEDLYEAAPSAARVAVVYSFDTERAYHSSSDESDFYNPAARKTDRPGDFAAAFHGVCETLCGASVPFDALSEPTLTPERLARYECLILPTCACLSDASVGAIRGYVRGGGALLASFETAFYDQHGRPRGAGALADVLGVESAGEFVPLKNYNYVTLTEPPEGAGRDPVLAGLDAIPMLPAPDTACVVRATGGAKVVARFHAPMRGRYAELTPPTHPAIVLNTFGRGRSVYLAGTFAEVSASYEHLEYRRLVENFVGLHAPSNPRLEGALGGLEMTVRRQSSRLVVHLVNHAGVGPRPFLRVAPQRGVALVIPELKAVRARAMVAGVDCPAQRQPHALRVELPEIGEYEVVAVDIAE